MRHRMNRKATVHQGFLFRLGQVRLRRRVAAVIGLPVPLLALCCTLPAKADEPVWATGHVADADGDPLVGAIVAVYDDSNHVVDYARTDRSGDYALAVPPRAIHLEHRPGKG